MGKPVFLAENFFSPQFPLHTLATFSGIEPGGHELFRAGAARRGPTNFYAGQFGTIDIRVETDRVRTADTLIIDRNSVLAESEVSADSFRFTYSTDGGSTEVDLTDKQPPSTDVVLGSGLNDQPHWIRTSEGARIFHFPEVAADYWRLSIVGTGTRTIGGLYLGKSYTPTYPLLPFDDEERWAEFGTVRKGVPGSDWRRGRDFKLGLLMRDRAEWNELRKIRELSSRGFPCWVVPDADEAERAGMFYLASGSFQAPYSRSPVGRDVAINFSEYQPALP